MGADKKRQREDGPVEATTSSTDQSSSNPNKRPRVDKNRSLFVRSLPPSATSESLTNFFSQHYPVKHATVVLDPKTKTSRGYGFVSFADPEDAIEAKIKLNNELLDGRRLRLDIAQPRLRDAAKVSTEVAARVVTEKRQREEELAEQRKAPKLIIRNLPWSIKSSEQLAKLFQPFGKIKFADLPNSKGKLSGFGFVTLRGRKNAEKALEAINGKEIDGRTVAVDWAVDKQTWEQHKEEEEGGEETKTEKKKAKKAKKEEEKEEEEDPNMTQEDRDLANFFKNYGKNLEDEVEDDDEDVNSEDEDEDDDEEKDSDEEMDEDGDAEFEDASDDEEEEAEPEKKLSTDNSTTVFIRNLPYTATDEQLKAHFETFGAVRYARVVKERGTDRPAGTGFVCFFNHDDYVSCLKGAPRRPAPTLAKHSVLQDETLDPEGTYTLDGRILQVAPAVDKSEAARLQEMSASKKDKDKRRLFLLQEGQIPASSPVFKTLSDQEIKMREASAKQRKKLIESNPALHISLTRLAVRNIPANMDSKALKALAREAVVGFAKDVKEGKRAPLSKEENLRGGEQDKEAERHRKEKGKGVVKQAKIVFETVQGSKIDEKKAEGGGKSRGYGFIEYTSHRWALMGLRWLNGHAMKNEAGKTSRLIVEFAIENANVVQRRRQHEQKIREEGPRAPGSRAEREKRERERERGRKNRWERKEEKKRPDTWNKSSKGKKSAVPKEEKGKAEPQTKEGKKNAEAKLAMRTKIVARKREMRKKKAELRGEK
uniref:Nucleolar protein n=1 Tax=Podospora anserina (strain S / ATCC MYA-4624 / DSM 980 / FGSC 10383) TaxID=515849 RepID=A0A090DCJ5_PODAN|nr:Putative nucleolar protein [Podospora anserina S mat+]